MKDVPVTSTSVSVPELPRPPRSYAHSLGRVLFRGFFGNWKEWFKDVKTEKDLPLVIGVTLMGSICAGLLWVLTYVLYGTEGLFRTITFPIMVLFSTWISYYTSAMVLGMLSRPFIALHQMIQKDRYLP